MSASETWGWLVTMTEPVRMYDLSSSFTVGRDPSLCTLFIDEDLFERIGINFKNEKYVKSTLSGVFLERAELPR